jgi:hypothetical protein
VPCQHQVSLNAIPLVPSEFVCGFISPGRPSCPCLAVHFDRASGLSEGHLELSRRTRECQRQVCASSLPTVPAEPSPRGRVTLGSCLLPTPIAVLQRSWTCLLSRPLGFVTPSAPPASVSPMENMTASTRASPGPLKTSQVL